MNDDDDHNYDNHDDNGDDYDDDWMCVYILISPHLYIGTAVH
jgi:hypothetical protein